MSAAMSSSSSDPPIKDRKKSAHWTDADTEVLVTLLLGYKDTGRTTDNGFKPEVWREASALLDGSTFVGGPKTADACKSRWQRLQRDFKAAKEMESLPGFSWDRTNHRLQATQDVWDVTEKTDTSKYQKIHLPAFDSLALLCAPNDSRGRAKGKTRASMASLGDGSSMLSLSTGSGPGHVPQADGMGNENGHQHMASGQMEMSHGLAQDPALLHWEGGENHAGGEFEGSFTMPDGTRHPFAIPHGQKRLPFDPSMLAGPSSQPIGMPKGPSPPKKPRPANATPHTSHSLPQTPHAPPPPHTNYHMPLPPASGHSRPPDFPASSSSLLAPGLLLSPQRSLSMHVATPQGPPPIKPYIQPSNPPGTMTAEVQAAGLSDAQRRTEALQQLQSRETDLSDEDLIEIMAEFVANVAAADTYLAIKRDGLRRMWLLKLLQKRKR